MYQKELQEKVEIQKLERLSKLRLAKMQDLKQELDLKEHLTQDVRNNQIFIWFYKGNLGRLRLPLIFLNQS